MKKTILVALFLVLGLAPATGLAAHEPGEQAQETIIRFLDLSDAQVVEWDELLAERRVTVEPLRDELGDVLAELEQALNAQQPDPFTVGTLTLEAKALRDQIRAANQAHVTAFEELLDLEQAARLGFIRRAARAQPLIPAFRLFGLLPSR